MEVFLLVTAGWIFSVCLHEFGHALVAFRGGDHTVREKGYLTLNPIYYTHPVLSLVLPLLFLIMGGIGLPGGAVYINDHLLRSRAWRTATSLAGPLMNLVIILVLCIPFWLGLATWSRGGALAPALAFLLQLQLCAVLLNLLPIPPLDGFQALPPWLPEGVNARLADFSNAGLWILFLLMWTVPAVNHAFWGTVFDLSAMLGVDPRIGITGWRAFRFWA